MNPADLLRELAAAPDHDAMARLLKRHAVADLKDAFAAAAGAGAVPANAELLINIDGACRGNPGPMGAGVLVKDASGAVLSRVSRHLGDGTNNRAEYGALLLALEEAGRLGGRRLLILTDSALLANQMNASYRIKDVTIGTLASRALELMRGFEKVEIKAVPREQNAGADALATAAVRGRAAAS